MKKKSTKMVTAGLLVSVLAVFAGLLSNVSLRHNILADILPNVLVELTNQVRGENELPSLNTNPLLQRAAQLKADDMAKKGYFSHNSPDGETPWDWFGKANYDFLYAGENLAVNFSDSKEVEDAWLNSPTHRNNILDNKFTEIGIATAEGEYKGQPATFVVQMFGTPMPESKTAYLGEIIKEGESKLSTLSTSTSWKASGEMEIYMAVKKMRTLKVNTAAYNRLMRKIMVLLDTQKQSALN